MELEGARANPLGEQRQITRGVFILDGGKTGIDLATELIQSGGDFGR